MIVKVILFDLDETLMPEKASAEKVFMKVAKHVQEKYGTDADKFHSSIRSNARKIWHQLPSHPWCKKIGISSWEGLWAEFQGDHEMLRYLAGKKEYYQLMPWHITLQEFNIDDRDFASVLSQMFIRERRKEHVLFPETKNVLEILSSQYRLGIVTNGSPDLQRRKINGGKLNGYFEHIIISGEVNHGKPDRQIFEIAVEKFDADKGKVLMVGDNIENDIAGAGAAGIKTVWVNRNDKDESVLPVNPDFIIKGLNELKAVLSRTIRNPFQH